MTEKLCKEIETALHRQMKTPKDFDYLKERIYARLHILVSSTTLKRLWGYLDEGVTTREKTLDVLTQFLGYRNWEEFTHQVQNQEEPQSSPVMNRKISVKDDLVLGDCIRLTWQPGRVCDIEYLGDLRFKDIASENTRLQAGDTFQCSLIVEGEPLYLDNLIQGQKQPTAYVCGKKTGVLFEKVPLFC